MDTALWRAYLACAISFYAIIGVKLVTASSQSDANLTALVGLVIACINLSVFGGWTLYARGVKA